MTGFEAVQLSYDEPLAGSLHTRLARVLGGSVKRLHGVRGMRRAYRLTAELVDTEQFFLADGDFAIDPEFPTAAVQPLADGVAMRVWQAVNPVNGLTYGYGGLKLIAARRSGDGPSRRRAGRTARTRRVLPPDRRGHAVQSRAPSTRGRRASESVRCSRAAASTA